MTRGRLFFVLLSLIVVLPLVTGGFGGAWARSSSEEDSFYKYLSVFTEVLQLVRTVYVEELDIQPLMTGALDGATDALDPFSVYVPKEQVTRYDEAKSVGRSRSGVMMLKERGVAYVAGVDEGGPGHEAGLRRGDVVSKIDGASTREQPLWSLIAQFAQEPGIVLELEVVRQGEPSTVQLELASFEPPEPRGFERSDYRVVRIAAFESDSQGKVKALIEEFGSADLVLDLRGVSGGAAELGYDLASLFVTGRLGDLKGRTERLDDFSSDTPLPLTPPVAVVVDRGTQGAAEVAARVLQESAGTLVVGETTFGHAGRASRISLSSGAMLELTDAFYTGPDGEPIDEGIEPDVEVDTPLFVDDENGDEEFLDRALEALREHDDQERQAA